VALADIRRDYLGEPLSEAHSDVDPMQQFAAWFERVREIEADPTAMFLATATSTAVPRCEQCC
jgi:pyridoxamine 5'-phosphate oxidase